MKASGKKALKRSWTAVDGAEGCDVFFGPCNGECELKATVAGRSLKIGQPYKGTAYSAHVWAWRTENGAKAYIGQASPNVFALTGGSNRIFTDPKKVTVKKKKLTLKVGGVKKIRPKVKKVKGGKRYLNYTARMRYFSSNPAVATVDARGRVTGVGAGSCVVSATTENGLRASVRIKVR